MGCYFRDFDRESKNLWQQNLSEEQKEFHVTQISVPKLRNKINSLKDFKLQL